MVIYFFYFGNKFFHILTPYTFRECVKIRDPHIQCLEKFYFFYFSAFFFFIPFSPSKKLFACFLKKKQGTANFFSLDISCKR